MGYNKTTILLKNLEDTANEIEKMGIDLLNKGSIVKSSISSYYRELKFLDEKAESKRSEFLRKYESWSSTVLKLISKQLPDKKAEFIKHVKNIKEEIFLRRSFTYDSIERCKDEFQNSFNLQRGILDFLQESSKSEPVIEESIELIEKILAAFHTCAQHLSNRKRGKPNFVIGDEYDLQDLLYVMLKPVFPDLEYEEWTSKIAGSGKRVDFLIKDQGIIIETKRIRDENHAKSVWDELKIDMESYYNHSNCDVLVFFIYDPLTMIEDPQSKMRELSGVRNIRGKGINIRVIIRPH